MARVPRFRSTMPGRSKTIESDGSDYTPTRAGRYPAVPGIPNGTQAEVERALGESSLERRTIAASQRPSPWPSNLSHSPWPPDLDRPGQVLFPLDEWHERDQARPKRDLPSRKAAARLAGHPKALVARGRGVVFVYGVSRDFPTRRGNEWTVARSRLCWGRPPRSLPARPRPPTNSRRRRGACRRGRRRAESVRRWRPEP